jgi:hypothetical protein
VGSASTCQVIGCSGMSKRASVRSSMAIQRSMFFVAVVGHLITIAGRAVMTRTMVVMAWSMRRTWPVVMMGWTGPGMMMMVSWPVIRTGTRSRRAGRPMVMVFVPVPVPMVVMVPMATMPVATRSVLFLHTAVGVIVHAAVSVIDIMRATKRRRFFGHISRCATTAHTGYARTVRTDDESESLKHCRSHIQPPVV